MCGGGGLWKGVTCVSKGAKSNNLLKWLISLFFFFKQGGALMMRCLHAGPPCSLHTTTAAICCVYSLQKLHLTLYSKAYSLEKWLHNWICYPSNRSKQIRETHTADSAGTQYTRQSLNEKQHASQTSCCLWSHACMLFFIQTLPLVLCAGAISPVSFSDLFGPITGVTNPIMQSLLRRICSNVLHSDFLNV